MKKMLQWYLNELNAKNHSLKKKKTQYPTSANCVPSNLGGKRERKKKLKC